MKTFEVMIPWTLAKRENTRSFLSYCLCTKEPGDIFLYRQGTLDISKSLKSDDKTDPILAIKVNHSLGISYTHVEI